LEKLAVFVTRPYQEETLWKTRRRLLAAALAVLMLITALPALATAGSANELADQPNGESGGTVALPENIVPEDTGITLKGDLTPTAEQPATLTVGDGVHLQVSSMAQVNPNATILSGDSPVRVREGAFETPLPTGVPRKMTDYFVIDLPKRAATHTAAIRLRASSRRTAGLPCQSPMTACFSSPPNKT